MCVVCLQLNIKKNSIHVDMESIVNINYDLLLGENTRSDYAVADL